MLPPRARIVWETPLPATGLGGIAATPSVVVFGDRNAEDTHDVFAAYGAADGRLLWTHSTPAMGELDYGNTPRATPLIDQDVVYTLGAFGDLACLDLETGIALWQKNIRRAFDVKAELMWGTSSSPLLVNGDKLIINPGGAEASVVALDATTGGTVWKSPGDAHAYASFCLATLGGQRQIVGYDRHTLGGWDPDTGRRLWKHVPEVRGDFNVPSPMIVDRRLFVATENNAARLFAFNPDGTIRPRPVARQDELAPDMSSPVSAAGRIFCVNGSLYCLDAVTLQIVWTGDDPALAEYNALIADDERILVVGRGGTLLLVDAQADQFEVVSRLDVLGPPSHVQLYSHPALVGSRLYLRGEQRLVCVELGDTATNQP